ncbi:MAG: FkbM family methyltransferase, partial [Gemmatimonadota bacterium]|nr:FkbM family methyltransferase [Gemmatimonadota bacterium]
MRLPLRLLPDTLPIKVLQGPARGRWWLAGSYTHGMWLGTYEHRFQRIFASYLRPGQVVYDLGANAGLYSIIAASAVGESGSVVAVEPLPRNLRFLRRNIALNRFTQVDVIDAAVSDHEGTARFDVADNVGVGHLSDRGSLEVQLVSLDALIAKGRIRPPDIMKIDVEGAAGAVLR